MLLLVGVVILVAIACGANASNLSWFDEFSVWTLDTCMKRGWHFTFSYMCFTRKPQLWVMEQNILSKK